MEPAISIIQVGNGGSAVKAGNHSSQKVAGSGSGSGGISDSTFLAAESEKKLEPIAANAEITLTSALPNDAAATTMSEIVSAQNLRVFDNDGTMARMDWDSSYAKPTRSQMVDTSGGGFLATLTFANNLKNDIARGRGESIGSLSVATAKQAYEVGKYKLNKMWSGASNADRAAALKASSSTPKQLRELGLNIR